MHYKFLFIIAVNGLYFVIEYSDIVNIHIKYYIVFRAEAEATMKISVLEKKRIPYIDIDDQYDSDATENMTYDNDQQLDDPSACESKLKRSKIITFWSRSQHSVFGHKPNQRS